MAETFANHIHQQCQRAERRRAVGGGRSYDLPLAIRIALVLTYPRLHIPQTTVALFGATQADVSRDLRHLLPLIQHYLPCLVVWEVQDAPAPLSANEQLTLVHLAEGRVLIHATEQRVARPQTNTRPRKFVPSYRRRMNDVGRRCCLSASAPTGSGFARRCTSATQKAHYSGKKKAFTLKIQVVTDGVHHVHAISTAVPGAEHNKALSDHVQALAHFPDGCEADTDKGYQGLAAQVQYVTVCNSTTGETQLIPRLTVKTPFKKPKGQDLTDEQMVLVWDWSSLQLACIGTASI